MELPKVSILTPTYNRRNFKELIQYNIKNLNYPKNLLEHIIFDDHENKLFIDNNELKEFEKNTGVKTIYIYKNNKHYSIGEKRNILTKNSNYKILFNIDDDDILLPNSLLKSIIKMKEKKCSLVGSNQMQFIFPLNDYKLCFMKCEAKRQVHESGMLYTKKHFNSMGGYVKNGTGEGCKLIDNNEKNVELINISDLIICVCHDNNTCCKERFLEERFNLNGNLNNDNEYVKILKKIFNN
tara:strand:+ start:1005 stop:1721 length:717 start_codon:yes stop_codon:yes gene_type:complete